MNNYATARQLSLITRLCAERGLTAPDFAGLTVAQASEFISKVFAAPAPARAERVTQVGMYRTADGAIYRVQASRGTGNLYAKRLLASGGFEYAAGAIRHLTAADRMTLAEAQAFGVATGICCVCGAFLTDPVSVAQGIGPVCASRF